MTTRYAILAGTVALALGACGPAEVSSSAYYDTGPELAYVSPGVSVVAGYDAPVFYASNYYWRYQDGVWYRSPFWYGGWSSVSHVPYAVARIDRPWIYTHVRASGPGYYGPRAYGPRRVYGTTYRGRGGYTVRPVPRGMRVPVRGPSRDHRRY
jgi:hypothetical protein